MPSALSDSGEGTGAVLVQRSRCLLILLTASLLVCGSCRLLIAAAAPASEQPPALGLAVQPGGMLIQDISPGGRYDLKEKTGIGLTVFNRDSRDHTYLLSTHRPSEVGNRRLPSGYFDIPDPSWFRFEKPEVHVPAQGSVEVGMYLEVPGDERYHNQHWSVSVGVVGKPGPGEMLTLAVYPRFEIETTPATRAELRLRPAGEIGLAPSVVVFSGLAPGDRREAEFVLCNNDRRHRAHRYDFTILPEGESGDGRRIFPSAGYAWVPGTSWLRTRYPSVWVGKGRSLAVPFRVKIPNGLRPHAKGWEGIIFIKREDGATGFVRVVIKTDTLSPAGVS